MKSPFKVMSTAALAAAVAVPTLSVPAAEAAETSSFHSVALETEDGSVKTVPFTEYAKAKTFGTGELGEFVAENDVVAVSAEEGTFVSVRTLALAKIENPDADTAALLADLDDSEDNLVAEENVAEYTEFGEPEEVAPAVESVSANNLRVLEVNFNKSVDADTVSDDSIVVDGGNSYSVELSKDGMTAYAVFNSALSQSTKLDVTVDGVETVDGESLEDFETTVNAQDTTVPSIQSIDVLNAKQIKVNASEPIDFNESSFKVLGNVKVDGTSAIAKVTPNYADNSFVIEFSNVQDPGDYELELSELTDFADLKAEETTFSYTVSEDNDAPEVVSAEVLNKNEIEVTFDEAVEVNGTFEVDGQSANATPVAGSNGTKYKLSSFGALDLSAVVQVEVAYDGQEDVVGNEVDGETFTFNVEDDTTLPTVSHELESGNNLTLSFSKSMLSNEGTITVLDEDEEEVAEVDVSSGLFVADSNNQKLEVPGSLLNLDDVNPAEYTVVLEGLKDASIRENLLPKNSFNVSAHDTKNPTVDGDYLVTAGDKADGSEDTVTFYFSEDMDQDSVFNLSNFSDPSGDVLSSLSDVEVKSFDGDSVTIAYPNARNLSGSFDVYALKDDDGNLLSTTSVSKKTTAPLTVQSVEAKSTNSVIVEFSSQIKTVDPSLIKVTDGGSDYALATNATISSADSTKVTFDLNKDIDPDAVGFAVESNNYELAESVYGEEFASAFGTQSITDNIRPSVVETEALTSGIQLTFSEDIDGSTVGDLESDIIVKDENGTRVDISGNVTESSDGVVTISNVAAGEDYVVDIIPSALEDTNSNLVTSYTSSTIDVEAAGAVNGVSTTAETVDVTGAEEDATITLYDSSGNQVGSTQTADANGEAQFTGVTGGSDYYVTQTVNGVDSSASASFDVAPAAPTATGSTGDVGTVDVAGAEASVTVTLYDSSDNSVDTKTTDSNGDAQFTGVANGTDYYVTQEVDGVESAASSKVDVTQ